MNSRSMDAQPTRGFRGFVQKPLGKIVLVLLSFGALAALFYLDPIDGPFLGIPVFLVTGLALPIIWGMKRPRYLAAAALVVLVVIAPLATAVYTDLARSPVPAACSLTVSPTSCDGQVLENASVSPFAADPGTRFTWSVTVDPTHLPAGLSSTNWSNDTLRLFVSTCPGRNDPNFTNCATTAPLYELNYSFPSTLSGPKTVYFNQTVGNDIFWAWQMELEVQNASTLNFTTFALAGDLQASWIQGPVVGSYGAVYGALVGDIYILIFLYLGLPFYALLLLYMLLKNRERRRKEALKRALASAPADPARPGSSADKSESANPVPGQPLGSGSSSSPGERVCPSCGAVVYPSEAKCWKCGAALSDTGSPAP